MRSSPSRVVPDFAEHRIAVSPDQRRRTLREPVLHQREQIDIALGHAYVTAHVRERERNRAAQIGRVTTRVLQRQEAAHAVAHDRHALGIVFMAGSVRMRWTAAATSSTALSKLKSPLLPQAPR